MPNGSASITGCESSRALLHIPDFHPGSKAWTVKLSAAWVPPYQVHTTVRESCAKSFLPISGSGTVAPLKGFQASSLKRLKAWVSGLRIAPSSYQLMPKGAYLVLYTQSSSPALLLSCGAAPCLVPSPSSAQLPPTAQLCLSCHLLVPSVGGEREKGRYRLLK